VLDEVGAPAHCDGRQRYRSPLSGWAGRCEFGDWMQRLLDELR
jgi:hypothetical protein